MTVPTRLPIEVRGQLTERDHLDASRVVQRRIPSRWWGHVLFLGGPVFIVVMSMLGGMPLKHAVIANLFWIVFGPLMLFLGLPMAKRQTIRFLAKANPATTAPQLYRFSDTGYEEREGPVEVSIAWPAVTDAVETNAVLLLFTGRTSAYIVPRRALIAAGQLEDVRGLLRERLGERARLLTASEQSEAGSASR